MEEVELPRGLSHRNSSYSWDREDVAGLTHSCNVWVVYLQSKEVAVAHSFSLGSLLTTLRGSRAQTLSIVLQQLVFSQETMKTLLVSTMHT